MSKAAPGPVSAPLPADYNPIFEKLVAGNTAEAEALPGIVAYSLYKIAKREWTTSHLQLTGQRPTEAELQAYIATWTPSRLSGLLQEGNGVLLAFTERVVSDNRPQIREDALKGSLGRSIWHGMAAAACYTVILIGIALVLKFAGVDLLSTLQTVGTSPSTPAVIQSAPSPTG